MYFFETMKFRRSRFTILSCISRDLPTSSNVAEGASIPSIFIETNVQIFYFKLGILVF